MTRVISLSDEAYASLKMLKKEGESFSEIVKRVVSSVPKKDIMDLWGKWAGSKEELDRIGKEIYESRKRFKLRKVEF